jgi:hypothetical protein
MGASVWTARRSSKENLLGVPSGSGCAVVEIVNLAFLHLALQRSQACCQAKLPVQKSSTVKIVHSCEFHGTDRQIATDLGAATQGSPSAHGVGAQVRVLIPPATGHTDE